MKEGAVAQTAFVKLTLPSLFNDVFRKQFPRKLGLLSRKPGAAGNDGLPSAIECGNQGANGVRSKYAGVYMIVEEVAPLPSRMIESYILPLFELWRVARARPLKGHTPTRPATALNC